jgi:putative heme-binding domain-containing protein
MRRLAAFLTVFTCVPALARADNVQNGLRAPAGFEVTEFADSRLANDIYTLTLDPRGRVVVAGRGYLRTLIDSKGTGRADRAIDVADGPKDGAMGLLWEGDTLYVVGDGGLRRYRTRDGRADGPSEFIRKLRTGGEHDAHALRRGPDGWLYLLCGNNAGIDRSFAQLPTSPLREPVAGCVVRFRHDLKATEIVADGFRNPYGMDFSADGELFTFDSDNERCVSLPWYEPTRFYHVVAGRHYGWLSPQRATFWRLPPYYCDVTAPVGTFGRGSPTGVACYRHTQFPPHYRDGFFLLDWTFGKVYFVKLRRAGASYTCTKEVFLESVGDNGFAPTGIVVHPTTGDLFISIGGRGTRGAVYRVRYLAGLGRQPAEAAAPRRSLDWQPAREREWLARAAGDDALDRLNALILLRRHADRIATEKLVKAVQANWDHADRLVRGASADLIAALPASARDGLASQARGGWRAYTLALARDSAGAVDALPTTLDADAPGDLRLAHVRMLQRALGDLVARKARGTVWEGYSLRADAVAGPQRAKALATLRRAFPQRGADLDREISRTLAALEDEDSATLTRVADLLTATADPVEQIHYLIVLARLRAARPAAVTSRTADALLGLDRKLSERHLNRDSNWPLRLRELYAELARRDPGLNEAVLRHKEFGRADHVLFALSPGFDRPRAARLFLARAKADRQYPWNAGLVQLVAALPDAEALPALRRLWGEAGLEAALLPVLARDPRPGDRAKFLSGLGSPELATIRVSLAALEKLPPRDDPAEVAAYIAVLGRLPDGKEAAQLRNEVVARLRCVTGQKDLGADRQAWTDWLAKRHPDAAARLNNPDGVDVAAWQRRSRAIDWDAGNAGSGRAVFVKASCATCHSGGQALGPDLQGVAGRFSRADLLTAVVQPSRDISPRYRTTLIETTEGKTYQGLIVYEAVDGVLLQTATGPVRVAGEQIASRRTSPLSLMPAGLLDNLPDHDIADLFAYLRSLGTSRKDRKDRKD